MKLGLVAVGRMKAGPERELLRRYLDRSEALVRGLGFGAVQLTELDESRARTADARKQDEAAAIRARVPPGAAVLLLDEQGESLGSEQLAALLGRSRDTGVPATHFMIGGPDGFDPDFRAAHRTIGFGRATFPHQLVRVMLAEQIYRALTILAGHPYHRP